jgi:four helix bundle protein
MKDFRDLAVWQKAHMLALAVYRETRNFPQSELYGLTSQMRRGAASIPANIAEGCGRGTELDFGRFIQNAIGSASELEYHLLLVRDLAFLRPDAYATLSAECVSVRRMLIALRKRVTPLRAHRS